MLTYLPTFKHLLNRFDDLGLAPIVLYKPKIKYSGIDVGITIYPNGETIIRTKKGILTASNDESNLTEWMNRRKACFFDMKRDYAFTIFGTWTKPLVVYGSIFPNQTCNTLMVHAVQCDELKCMAIYPADILAYLPGSDKYLDIITLPFAYEDDDDNEYNELHIDFLSNDQINLAILKLGLSIDSFSEQCDVLGIDAGLIYLPTVSFATRNLLFEDLIFKVSGKRK